MSFKRILPVLAGIVLFAHAAAAQTLIPRDPSSASVRIRSHGASGTIILSQPGRSWILGCAHMFLDDLGNPSETLRNRPLKIDGPPQPFAPAKRSPAKLLAWDYDLDLSLIEIPNGPFYHIPVAPPGHQPSDDLWSLGYDEMKWPITKKRATLLSSAGDTTFTREKPWHGRSGGGLIDGKHQVLIGVVQGYEIWPNQRGLYVSHSAVLRFLQKHLPNAPRAQPKSSPQLCPT